MTKCVYKTVVLFRVTTSLALCRTVFEPKAHVAFMADPKLPFLYLSLRTPTPQDAETDEEFETSQILRHRVR